MDLATLDAHRKLGAAHNKIRGWVLDNMTTFQTDLDLARAVERQVIMSGYRPAFPCMVSVDDCVAHWTPSGVPGEAKPIKLDNLLKIDFGLVDTSGRIADAAFSFSSDLANVELIEVSQEAASLAISMAGPDAFIRDIGAAIQECIESKEIDGNQVQSVWDLCGHSIEPWKVHGRKAVPNIAFDLPPSMQRMKEGEVYAIEPYPTLGTTGDVTYKDDENQLFIFKYREVHASQIPLAYRKYTTLPFCKRWGAADPPSQLYNPLPPAYASGVTAQTEHNIYIRPERAELLT
jgi:methionyl aminopeptidase